MQNQQISAATAIGRMFLTASILFFVLGLVVAIPYRDYQWKQIQKDVSAGKYDGAAPGSVKAAYEKSDTLGEVVVGIAFISFILACFIHPRLLFYIILIVVGWKLLGKGSRWLNS